MGLFRSYNRRYIDEENIIAKRSALCSVCKKGYLIHRQYSIYDCEKCGQTYFFNEEENVFVLLKNGVKNAHH